MPMGKEVNAALNPGEAVVTASFATFTDQTALTVGCPLRKYFYYRLGSANHPDRNSG